MKKQAVSYFEIYPTALGPGSPALAGRARVDKRVAGSDLYQVARDIATRAGIEQGLILAPQHERERANPSADASMISVTQAVELIGITRAAVYKAVQKGALRANHIGNVTIVDRASAIAYKAGRHEAVARPPATRALPSGSRSAAGSRRAAHPTHA
jgi:hypothetical protein